MNNQAAQTMPELPDLPVGIASRLSQPQRDALAQYVADYGCACYAASQTAGVAIEPTREHIEAFKRAEIKCVADYDDDMSPEYRGLEAVFAMLASAPAASGGEEVSRTLPIDVRGQWYEVPIPVHLHVVYLRERLNNPATFFHDDTALANWLDSLHATNDDGASTDEKWEPAQRAAAFLRGELPPQATQPPAGASVSERARALLAQAYRDGGYPRAAGTLEVGVIDSLDACALSALEQALTQQRGECEAVDRDAWAEALELPQGYTVEEFLPGGWHYAWTRADGERMVSGTTWNHPALAAIAAWQYAPATTPQPGAEALRDVPGNDPRVDDDSFTAAVRACRSQLGALRPNDDEPEEQWMWDKLTKLESLLARGG